MTATPFDSAHLHRLFATGEIGKLFTDSAEIRAMMIVEGALARAQGEAGLIPETAARAIHRASLELQIDAGGLAEATGRNGVTVPGFVAAFRSEMQAPEHGQYLHWGATSQDIQDTALMLRLRQVLTHAETELRAVLTALATLAEAHAATPMAARTYGQHATPTSFGAVVAGWGWPLIELLRELPALREGALLVSLAGAAGTASELGAAAPEVRAGLARALDLGDPGRNWHTDRTPVLRIAGWISRLAVALGKMGQDLVRATQSDAPEVRLGTSGGSSTMPQKQNPVGPSVLVALSSHVTGCNATLQVPHAQQRDGASWFTEWLTFPQLVLGGASALGHARTLAETLAPDTAEMRATLDASKGLVLAEALSFALAETMPRPEAQAETKRLCLEVRDGDATLEEVARAAHPDLAPGLFDLGQRMGRAPEEARGFAAAVRAA
ncbi:lyase family protein [Salipiger mucosus]|uniref:3-carboxy-cis,cis-muconate cycloisomerase n=1 Tax=Salipiger mucosus DSM 16094 TaxID=1123237 RepID=S9R1N6_9RHOB|nr:lyase family protein [Salipiger mucosus]EPX85807.1 3-carboxy-cis,cis-muconate cycloisomerase [Salipiger mucosus DSM 16094]